MCFFYRLLVQIKQFKEEIKNLTKNTKTIEDLKNELAAVAEEKKELERQLVQLVGHHNPKQKVRYIDQLHEKIDRLQRELDYERGVKLRTAKSASRVSWFFFKFNCFFLILFFLIYPT